MVRITGSIFVMVVLLLGGTLVFARLLPRHNWDVVAFISKNDLFDSIILYDFSKGLMLKVFEVRGSRFVQSLDRLEWSPDGKTLLFDAFNQMAGIYTLNPYTHQATRLTTQADLQGATWLPDNQHVAYVNPFPPSSVFVHDLYTGEVDSYDYIPALMAFSPQGKIALQWFYDFRPPDLFILDQLSEGAPQRALVASSIYAPNWSHGGNAIAFIQGYQGSRGFVNQGIHVYDLTVDTTVQLTRDGIVSGWSRDDSQLLFFNDNNLYTVDVTSGEIELYARIGWHSLQAALRDNRADWKP